MKVKQDLNFGENFKKLRYKNNLTQEDVVIKFQLYGINMTRSQYSQIELGRYNVNFTELLALTDIFKCDYSDFFAGYSVDMLVKKSIGEEENTK
ncbi:transcriptional regulator with XRE-family HTH domain [Aequitasia blattaphilus]|uniref:Helix-turn-helix domain-containing protein n=1 Tax=Aequitasia blattaphilus TaxID=2949332 RepID=A0ABT1E4Z8_9FIRM|nr:helix-turn-helix transcriptional regulator [Aequitasia blattaphilus]MCP1100818.1 helix-turn-helix domain-containing protein [Aequitasia blattaphilus]MCR8613458.1 helix-turn-helix domain-containing protein [Aequitasia blattaphilus]